MIVRDRSNEGGVTPGAVVSLGAGKLKTSDPRTNLGVTTLSGDGPISTAARVPDGDGGIPVVAETCEGDPQTVENSETSALLEITQGDPVAKASVRSHPGLMRAHQLSSISKEDASIAHGVKPVTATPDKQGPTRSR